MRKIPRRKISRRLPASAALAFFLSPCLHALEVSEWKNRQTLAVAGPGIVKLALPPATLDLAQAGLADLRLLDPSGRETPFIIEQATPAVPATSRAPKAFRVRLTDNTTQLAIETGTDAPLEAIVLTTPATGFIKAARVEIAGDDEVWETVTPGTPVFRQFGTEQLQLLLEGRRASHVRVTIDDSRTAPAPFSGASVRLAPATPESPTLPLEIRVLRREEFAAESVLTLDLGAAHVPLAAVEFVTSEPLFARNLTLNVRELHDDTAVERPLAASAIYRIALENLPPSARLEVPVDFAAPSRELLVHIANGDSPPLAIETVRVRQRPRWLVFRAAEAGAFTVLTGNVQALPPRYDLSTLAPALKETRAGSLTLGPAELTPPTAAPKRWPIHRLLERPSMSHRGGFAKPST